MMTDIAPSTQSLSASCKLVTEASVATHKETIPRRVIFPWLNAPTEEPQLAKPQLKSILRTTKYNVNISTEESALFSILNGDESEATSTGTSNAMVESDSTCYTRSIKFDPVIRVRELRETVTKEELTSLWFTMEELRSFQYLVSAKIYRYQQITGKKIQTKAAFSHPALKGDDYVRTGNQQNPSNLNIARERRSMSAASA
mmetsp:Transcript_19553/g.27650  ORF Transcript_19553/g.27650 Transcript_19553/m.27650 type:complete len:201 (+) Transcript_19553:242-844(+)